VGSTTSVLAAERNADCPACGPCSPRALSDAAGAPEFLAPVTAPPPADAVLEA